VGKAETIGSSPDLMFRKERDTDRPDPQLVPYADAIAGSGFTPSAPQVAVEEDRPDW
jgi:hypothetical protein